MILNDDITEYIKAYVSHAYHNLCEGDSDIDYIQSELIKALNAITEIKRIKMIEKVNA